MSEVKRYVVTCDCISEAAWGDYVRHTDYAALEAERDHLKACQGHAQLHIEGLIRERNQALAECERLSGFLIRASKAKSAAELMLIVDAALSANP